MERLKLQTFDESFMVISNRAPDSNFTQLESKIRKFNREEPFCLGVGNKNYVRVSDFNKGLKLKVIVK